MATAAPEARRPSIEKPLSARSNPFEALPDEIIEQILLVTDPNSFASLVLLNRKWRDISQRPHLYHHHLLLCPSYSAGHSTPPACDDENLPELRRLFAREVKRNLFEAYLRPRETIVKLVSTSISSSSSPGGEGMQFSASPRGHRILAYNSSRIYVLDVRKSELEVLREFKILRRPVSACIKDDGSLLAVLSSEMQVDLYDLSSTPPQRKQSLILDNTPRTIALSPCGSVLAAAYEGGIEVSSLNPGALPTERRAVKCDAVDALAFSFDGTQLLGTTIHSSPPSTVIITAPYFDPGSQLLSDDLTAMWTNSILFPNTSRDCSHAVLLQDGSQEEAAWTFTYDRSFETFRAVRIDDLRNGTTYFTGPVPEPTSQAKLLPCTSPAATYHGELVSAGFQGKELWVYGVPEDLDAVLDASSSNDGSSASSFGRQNSIHSTSQRHTPPRSQDTNGLRVPQWQLLCDKQRNTFVAGRKISELSGLATVKWVEGFGNSSFQERMVAGARGVSGPRLVTDDEDIDFVDGGRITLLDFDYGISDGTKQEITIEVGTTDAEPLEEEQRDMETEVAIVRRRTVAQRRSSRMSLVRAATSSANHLPLPPVPPLPQAVDADDDPLVPRRMGQNPTDRRTTMILNTDDGDTASIEEALDLPYANASPRSGPTLRRAATAAAVNRRLNPRLANNRPIEYRRADGRNELPHESDADNWVPPPPPYQKEDPGEMPMFMRGSAITPSAIPPVPSVPPVPPLPLAMAMEWWSKSRPDTAGPSSSRPSALHDMVRGHDFPIRRRSHQRTASDSTTFSRRRLNDTPRPMSSPSIHLDAENLYDVSPQESPRLAPRHVDEEVPDHSPEDHIPPASSVSPPTSDHMAAAPPSAIVSAVEAANLSERTEQMHEARPSVPTLGLRIPSIPQTEAGRAYNTSASAIEDAHSVVTPAIRRLSNSQTWPRAPRPATSYESSHPYSAPVNQLSGNMDMPLPPLPTPSQINSLNKRMSQSNPRRLSGGFQVPRIPVGSRDGERGHSRRQSSLPLPAEPDQPLIISTPTGVSGAFDAPNMQSPMSSVETPILAPVPRYPRNTPGPVHRPTVERLETMYTTNSQSHNYPQPPPIPSGNSGVLPTWLRAPSVSSRPTSIRRRRSRAERSAARNVQEAKKSGWTGRKKTKKEAQRIDTEMMNNAGDWTDESVSSPTRHRRCIVM